MWQWQKRRCGNGCSNAAAAVWNRTGCASTAGRGREEAGTGPRDWSQHAVCIRGGGWGEPAHVHLQACTHADVPHAAASSLRRRYIWSSTADGSFAISEDTENEPLGRGTLIKIHLKEEAQVRAGAQWRPRR